MRMMKLKAIAYGNNNYMGNAGAVCTTINVASGFVV
jgi:hypothetical protein